MPSLAILGYEHITVPKHVKVEIIPSFEGLMNRIGVQTMLGFSGQGFFGSAFVQGNRLCFTTAVTIKRMLEIAKDDRAKKKDNVATVMEKSNRAPEARHALALRGYLLDTMCQGHKFILPAFTVNYGVGLTDDDPQAILMIFGAGAENTTGWPAMFILPGTAKLDTTDGAHRKQAMTDILGMSKLPEDQKDLLRYNGVDLKIVFESNRSDSHQDFADCGKAKAIAKSTLITFDVRDLVNKRTRELVGGCSFLGEYVDATASNVNLSGQSRMIWSMSAVRIFVGHCTQNHPDPERVGKVNLATEGAEQFFDAMVRHIPTLRALAGGKEAESTTGSLRDQKGGNVLLRGMGMSVLARALMYCREHSIPFDDIGKILALIDWHCLKIERKALPEDPTKYADAVRDNANPLWAHLLQISEQRYRISSSSDDADKAWENIKAKYIEPAPEPAPEEDEAATLSVSMPVRIKRREPTRPIPFTT